MYNYVVDKSNYIVDDERFSRKNLPCKHHERV